MNAIRFPIAALTAAATVAASTLMAPDAFAKTRCEAPRDRADRTACEKAAEGPDSLRRYIARTQSLYQLYYWDYMPQDDARSAQRLAQRASGGDEARAEARDAR